MDMRYDRLFGLFIVFVMVGSIAGIAVYNTDDTPPPTDLSNLGMNEDSIEVNGYYFNEDAALGGFVALVSDQQGNALSVPFRSDPRNLSQITIEDDTLITLANAQSVYITFDPNTEDFEETKNGVQVAMAQVSRLVNRVSAYGVYPTGALTADVPNETYDDQIPIKSCNDSTETIAVIFFTIGQGNRAFMQDDCIIISGNTPDDILDVADKYGMYLVGLRI